MVRAEKGAILRFCMLAYEREKVPPLLLLKRSGVENFQQFRERLQGKPLLNG